MKQCMAFVLALSLLLATATPVYAAKKKTFQQRADEIEKTYGILVSYDEAGADQALDQLTEIEAALSQLGSIFTKKMARYYSYETMDGILKILITADENWEALDVVGSFSSLNNTIDLYVRADSVTPAANIIHEFGHVYHWSLVKGEFEEFCEINGGQESYNPDTLNSKRRLDTERYVSKFASTRAAEDFAETFRTMIQGAESVSVSEDSILYRKFAWMQDSLSNHIGAKSFTTMRASIYLDMPVEE